MGFSWQEYWSGLPCPSPGIFLTQGSNLCLMQCRQILYLWATGENPGFGGPGLKPLVLWVQFTACWAPSPPQAASPAVTAFPGSQVPVSIAGDFGPCPWRVCGQFRLRGQGMSWWSCPKGRLGRERKGTGFFCLLPKYTLPVKEVLVNSSNCA